MPASNYAGNAFLNCFLRGVAPTPPTEIHLSLHTDNPGNAGGNEVSTAAWPAYTRKSISDPAGIANAFATPSSKSTSIAQELLWPANNGTDPISISHYAIWTAASGGSVLFYGPLSSVKILQQDDELVIYPDMLTVTVD